MMVYIYISRADARLAQQFGASMSDSEVVVKEIYLIKSSKLLDKDLELLATMLDAESYMDALAIKKDQKKFYILPRKHSKSAWSSKAMSIFQNVKFTAIENIEKGYIVETANQNTEKSLKSIFPKIADKMTQSFVINPDNLVNWFDTAQPESYKEVPISEIDSYNQEHRLSFDAYELSQIKNYFTISERNPTDVELIMYSQVNSEHCRHKIFNSQWRTDGKVLEKSLFDLIKDTFMVSPDGVITAYKDNAAIVSSYATSSFLPDKRNTYTTKRNQQFGTIIKVETHNHPTAVSPFFGASTGVGGEIRDEMATGIGAESLSGMSGFVLSDLNIPENRRNWELFEKKPDNICSSLEIILQGSLGVSAFANEFGRPNLNGFFRTFLQKDTTANRYIGFHKPIMVAGGMGLISSDNYYKEDKLSSDDYFVVIGGPALLIGLGGGSQSSTDMEAGGKDELDFMSVQRDNAEIQRRVQEVINVCSRSDKKLIRSLHDVGAGGLSNAFTELAKDGKVGALMEIRNIPNDQLDMTPLEIWCNEAQERLVLAIAKSDFDEFIGICERERCPYAIVGMADESSTNFVLTDKKFKNKPVNLDLNFLFDKNDKSRNYIKNEQKHSNHQKITGSIEENILNVLRLPAVASKRFLITIGDRTVGGLTVQDQMVGKYQVPVSNFSVVLNNFLDASGQVMSIGERIHSAHFGATASARMAIGEALTNIAGAHIHKKDIKFSANWMANCSNDEDASILYDAVLEASQFCQKIGVSIPVGKDSLSMKTSWVGDDNVVYEVSAPTSLVITAVSPIEDASKFLTPELVSEPSVILLINLGSDMKMGGSCLFQTKGIASFDVPTIAESKLLSFLSFMEDLHQSSLATAYHDRSDGGLITTLIEMAITSRVGLDINLSDYAESGKIQEALFNEELGVVIQVLEDNLKDVYELLKKHSLILDVNQIATINDTKQINILHDFQQLCSLPLSILVEAWEETSYLLQRMRDDATSTDELLEHIKTQERGLYERYDFSVGLSQAVLEYEDKLPKVAILREEGTNSHKELAYAFHKSKFEVVDVHMTDLIEGRVSLRNFHILALAGGFSYGDVMGSGKGWAYNIMLNEKLKKEFFLFFQRKDTLTLGVCNGCQMLPYLKELIPGASHFEPMAQNKSRRFEAHSVQVKIGKSNSVFFQGMEDSELTAVLAHGEGRFTTGSDDSHIVMRYFDGETEKNATSYPKNPNGSEGAIAGMTNIDGRVTMIMPHPERTLSILNQSWKHPSIRKKDSSVWQQMFYNARNWVQNFLV